ncbi:MAG: hypothetical protein JNM56_06015 [Planctomycetia bacterium]|nr:hypothetical protein [Planctomycetia bacterium]
MPNSVIQGLTTTTTAQLNHLPAFPTTVLLGLFTLLDSDHPEKEVCARPSDILDIIEIGKTVALTVDRQWDTDDGQSRTRRYQAERYSPTHLTQIHQALAALHRATVVLHRREAGQQPALAARTVHVLDSFGYLYRDAGQPVDLDDLPVGETKVNVGTEERPLWRLRHRTKHGERDRPPNGILFRLNVELTRELTGSKGTIGFTLLARKVFGLLRQFHRQPKAVRLILLILRQTGTQCTRQFAKLLTDLGFDAHHPTRSLDELRTLLEDLQVARLLNGFRLDVDQDRLLLELNKAWHRESQID